tara:strand:+ start:3942 stop:4091 length:150 start_codon:yes stop_codon:yes gene_type:complete
MNTETVSIPKEMLEQLIVYLHSVGDDGAMSWIDIIETYTKMWDHFHKGE